MYNYKKWNQKNMKECDKLKSHISSKLHMIYIPSNNVRHPVTKTFTTLHPTTLHSTSLHFWHFTFSHLNFTQLHFTTLSFGLTPFKFPVAPFHLTSPHFTSPHFPALLDDFCHTNNSFNFTPFIIAFLTLSKNLRFTGESP
jgi:hypothetical protein